MKKSTNKKKPATAPAAKSAGAIDIDMLSRVSSFMQENDLCEIEFKGGGVELKLKRGGGMTYASPAPSAPVVMAAAPMAAPAPALMAAPATEAPASKTKYHVVSSPFVGTFYRSPGPNQDAFVEVGKVVAPGDTMCIVEAMKLMNEIETDAKGRVARVLVNDGTPVEFGEALFEIDPL